MARDAQAVQDRIVLALTIEWSPVALCRQRCEAFFKNDDTFDACADDLVKMGFIERGKHHGAGRLLRLTDLGRSRQQFLTRERNSQQGALYAR